MVPELSQEVAAEARFVVLAGPRPSDFGIGQLRFGLRVKSVVRAAKAA